MEISFRSVLQDILSREIGGIRVRKRSHFNDMGYGFEEVGVATIDHHGEKSPPLSISFGKSNKSSHLLAVSDEEGYLSLFNTRNKFHVSGKTCNFSDKAKVSEWVAHQNAIFDVCWIKDDCNILTASGDQSIRVWDVEQRKCIVTLIGHRGSVKSLSPHPSNPELLATCSRDGSFAMWDLRCRAVSVDRQSEASIRPCAVVEGAHLPPHSRRARRLKAASMSITSVLYLRDDTTIATAGARDSIVKLWDTRNLKTHVALACPPPDTSTERLHGVSCLSQDSMGVFLLASCMDNRLYMYNLLHFEKGPIKTFFGCPIKSFYVKSSISPDASHVLSGASDGNARVWQVDKPNMDPIKLKIHSEEVTAVDWCPHEIGKIATSSDDFTVRIWTRESSHGSTKSPYLVRRRVTAMPRSEREVLMQKKSSFDSETEQISQFTPKSKTKAFTGSEQTSCNDRSPEIQKKIFFTLAQKEESLSGRVEEESPSSVLSPPSSVQRKTIKDYFLLA